jgi:hypothetical protein
VELSPFFEVQETEAAMNQIIRRGWTEEDSDKIRSLAGKVSLEELARQLNRTEAATRVQAWKLGFSVKSAVGAGGQAHRD